MPEFNLSPSVRTFLHEAYVFGILEDARIPNILLNFHIQLKWPNSNGKVPRAHFDFEPTLSMVDYAACGSLRMQQFAHSSMVKLGTEGLHELIKGLLSANGYIYVMADYCHFNDSGYFRGKSFRHPILIYHYDSNLGKYQCALYNKNGAYNGIAVSICELNAAITFDLAGCKRYLPNYNPDLFSVYYKPHANINFIDLDDIGKQLACYYYSKSLQGVRLNNLHLRKVCDESALDKSHYTYGISAYDCIAKCIKTAFARKHPTYGVRIARLLWEHKKVMNVRIHMMEELGVSLPSKTFDDWAQIVEFAHFIHIKAVSSAKRGTHDLLNSLDRDLLELKLMVSSCLRPVLSKMNY